MVNKKISILCLHLSYGGIEQSCINIANMLSEKYNVELVSFYKIDNQIPYYINSKVNILYLSDLKPNKDKIKLYQEEKKIIKLCLEIFKAIKIIYKKRTYMKKYLRKTNSDIVISSRIYYTKILNKSKKNIIKIAQEHCHHNNNQKYIKKLKKSCSNIDYMINVSEELNNDYTKEKFNLKIQNIFIPNSLEKVEYPISNLKNKKISMVGRLSPEKGFLDAISVFNEFEKRNPGWQLNIIGDGEEKIKIKESIKNYNLENKVILHGFRKKDYIYKSNSESSIFLMTSYEESFGMVLIEAAASGLPLISYDSAQGAKEIIEENKNGYLIKNRNPEEMINKIEELIQNEKKINAFSKKSIEISKKYKYKEIQKKWFDLIETIISKEVNK